MGDSVNANPLRRSKPAREQRRWSGRVYFTDENGKLLDGKGQRLYLAADHLWISSELSVPLSAVTSLEIRRSRGLIKRRFLDVRYLNPISGAPEFVAVCSLDFLGFSRLGPIEELKARIEAQMATLEATASPTDPMALDQCEVCGAKPAYYVGYMFLVSAIFFSYQSAVTRRIHCRKHNALHGFGRYLLTALVGWIGVGVFAYPFVVFGAARSLEPTVGKAWYALAALPMVCVAGLVARAFLA
jgi:hypothetical protein